MATPKTNMNRNRSDQTVEAMAKFYSASFVSDVEQTQTVTTGQR
jgi:hypothetical protein